MDYRTHGGENPLSPSEVCERDIIEHPWVQRMRHIHQLQTAWWVYPSAEHSRYQHILGVMHLASRWVQHLYPSLQMVCSEVPSLGYVESLMRMAGLLHDIGHGPFGHFFDEHYLQQFSLTHESLGAQIIRSELGSHLSQIRGNPNSQLSSDEQLDPNQVAWIIQRAQPDSDHQQPRWLIFLRSLLSGIYTVDNMDFVLRDAYMTGYSQRSFDIERLLRYSYFSERGLTLQDRGIPALLRFMTARAELFRNVYFHRRVRAIDLTLSDLLAESMSELFPGNPRDHMQSYLHFTESSLLSAVATWSAESGHRGELGQRWDQILHCRIPWKMVCQRTITFDESDSEASSIFSDSDFVDRKLRSFLPLELQDLEVRIDIARQLYRPHPQGTTADQNFILDTGADTLKRLTCHELIDCQPIAQRICRVYAHDYCNQQELTAAMELLTGQGEDDLTNM